jgi:hypothetical protein
MGRQDGGVEDLMNIKEHIEAGHYPTDDKGRALVPTEGDHVATIYATDHMDGGMVIVGRLWVPGVKMIGEWTANGRPNFGVDLPGLLPPPPRKVKVTRWAVMYLPLDRNQCHSTFNTETDAQRELGHFKRDEVIVVPLTGEYEEPWS